MKRWRNKLVFGLAGLLLAATLAWAAKPETVETLFVRGMRANQIRTLTPGGNLTIADNSTGTVTIGGAGVTSVAVVTDGGTVALDGSSTPALPAQETIAAAGTITANACGTIKRIASAAAVTTNTTNTFTAPAAANAGCVMHVCNMNASDAITLDDNANFDAIDGANIALAAGACVTVGSTGTVWKALSPVVDGTA